MNTTDLVGGAERCSFDLHRGLRERGHSSTLIVGRKLSNDPDVHSCSYALIERKMWTFFRHTLGLTESILLTPFRKLSHPAFRQADVVNLHNMHGCYWNFWTVPLLARSKPVVLTLHDEWLLTGDCAYTYDCDRWLQSCGSCPQMSHDIRPVLGGRDMTRINIGLKRGAMSLSPDSRVHIVTPSAWLAGRAARSVLSRFPITVIPNGIDLGVFRPSDRMAAKASFSLPPDQFSFLFFAANLDDPRKGVEKLVRALRQFGMPPNSLLMLVGNGSQELARRLEGLPVVPIPFLDSPEAVARCLCAADCMLLLSEADNLPYTAIEAAACGCPTIATAVGGIPEEVADGGNGRLLTSGAPAEQLAAVMREFAAMTAGEWSRMSRHGRELAERKFSSQRFLTAYESLFQDMHAHDEQARAGRPSGAIRSTMPPSNQFEEQVVEYALKPENRDSFARLLGRILPEYTNWTWGQDGIYRRHFNSWQAAGFNLSPNHYYSPIPDVTRLDGAALNRRFSMAGVEMGEAAQLELLEHFQTFRPEYSSFPAGPGRGRGFHFRNGVFESCDAEVLHCMVRRFRPRRVVEVGSGYTTLITAAACEENRVRHGVECDFTAIEPYPNDLFRQAVPGLSRILKSPVQSVDREIFSTLGENDILFIDSSHVLKVGSDVELLYLEVLPALQRGVVVHIHDIFLPSHYPQEWIREEHIFWNEQQLLHAFLMFNPVFEVLWAGAHLHAHHSQALAAAFPAYDPSRCLPGSFWMRRTR